ncbi:hypothetical protein [Bacillus thuringiensis]|uniref:hypothetical protein n=1 Tax=Bacillus thuringiensis TaxID=1428 RepID=UPI0034578AEA
MNEESLKKLLGNYPVIDIEISKISGYVILTLNGGYELHIDTSYDYINEKVNLEVDVYKNEKRKITEF